MQQIIFILSTFLILNSQFLILHAAHAAPAPPIATGQTLCYDAAGTVVPSCAGTGQDGDRKPGAAWPDPRFTDNTNGTVTDNLTGLIWMKNANCTDAVGGVTPSSGLSWSNALTWSKALLSGKCGLSDASVAGDWRLPSLEDLMTLPNFSLPSLPPLDKSNSVTWLNTQGFSNVQAVAYWSSTTYASSTSNSWIVNMGSGSTGNKIKTNNNYVWSVRGDLHPGVVWPTSHFSSNGDQTVTDNLSGLTWTEDANPAAAALPINQKALTWQGALDYIKDLNNNIYLGYNDWRLPSVRELRTLPDYSLADSSAWLNTQGFDDVQAGSYWSSTTYAGFASSAWVVSMGSGNSTFGSKEDSVNFYVWPVRDAQLASLTLSISTLADGATTNNPIMNVAGTVGDNGNGIKSVTVKGQAATITNGTFSTAITLVNGSNSITITATDNSNNSKTETRTITLDSTAPVLTITTPADNSVTGQSFVEISGSVDDQNATVTTKVNTDSPTEAAKNGSNFSATVNLSSGMNTIDITATNQSRKSSSVKRTITFDANAPILFITNPAQDSSTREASVTISGTITDSATNAPINATVNITVDGQTYTQEAANGSFSQPINLLTEKSYTIVVTAYDQVGNTATSQRNIIKSYKAKVFLGAVNDNFTVSTSGTAVYGGAGSNEITIASDVTGVILDQNIERINLVGTSSTYKFMQTGNMINVYDTAGTTLIVRTPVQGDNDGTLIYFSSGTVPAQTKLTGGIMTLGGQTVRTDTPTTLNLSPTLDPTPSPTNITKAKVFLIAEDNFTVSNSGATLYGNSGKGSVTISDGVTDVLLDQNIGRINFLKASSSYTFKQTGNIINVCNTNGTTLIVKAPVQGDDDGTVLSFGNGTAPASVKLSGGVMTLGGIVVSPGTACGL